MKENKVIIYTANDGKTKIDVKLEEDTLWLTQAQMCELYQTSKSNVSEHIKHIFEEGELNEESVVRKFRTTAADGKMRMTDVADQEQMFRLIQSIPSPKAEPIKRWIAQVASERIDEVDTSRFR